MKIIYYQDDTLDFDLQSLCASLNDLSSGVEFTSFNDPINIRDKVISHPKSYKSLELQTNTKLAPQDRILVATKKPYDNNYFYDYTGNIGIFSFYGWDYLTDINEINGLVYFTCQLLSDSLQLGDDHDETTGCLNDFLWNKAGVDVGMRSAFLCPACLKDFDSKKRNKQEKEILTTLQALLDQLCLASRSSLSLLDYWGSSSGSKRNAFDVFLCHNSLDKDAIRELNSGLKAEGIKTWLDEEQLRPGIPWQDELEEQIQSISTVVIAVGASGIGPWQDVELRAFLGEFIRRGCPVIPLLLPDCKEIPKLPLFLNQFTWVDLRKSKPDPFKLLLWGITGRKH